MLFKKNKIKNSKLTVNTANFPHTKRKKRKLNFTVCLVRWIWIVRMRSIRDACDNKLVFMLFGKL